MNIQSRLKSAKLPDFASVSTDELDAALRGCDLVREGVPSKKRILQSHPELVSLQWGACRSLATQMGVHTACAQFPWQYLHSFDLGATPARGT